MTSLPPPPKPLDPLVELVQAPEMASVRHLDHALALLRLALLAQHPSLICHDNYIRRDGPPTLRRARTLLRKTFALHETLASYTLAVHDAICPATDPNDTLF